ncbi:MAG: helix-turn-helix domain-containing protein [Planctomycetes bacterium]|nr:helix-turn-helix domain-containing protein [Planctomycetota bacterium]
MDEAAELLGVSVKTFNKVLHSEDLPARKIGREWKFSRAALIAWVGSGKSSRFYRESEAVSRDEELLPAPRAARLPENGTPDRPRTRRTAGWQIEE